MNQFSFVSKADILFKFIRWMCYTLNYLNIPPIQFHIQHFLSEKTPSDAPRNSNVLRVQLRHTGCIQQMVLSMCFRQSCMTFTLKVLLFLNIFPRCFHYIVKFHSKAGQRSFQTGSLGRSPLWQEPLFPLQLCINTLQRHFWEVVWKLELLISQ